MRGAHTHTHTHTLAKRTRARAHTPPSLTKAHTHTHTQTHTRVTVDACCRLHPNNVIGVRTFAEQLMCQTLVDDTNKYIQVSDARAVMATL